MYLKDLVFDAQAIPVRFISPVSIIYLARQVANGSGGLLRFDGTQWHHHVITTSDHNYDQGELALRPDGTWRLLAPTTTGPQTWNTGGEMTLFSGSADGSSWQEIRQVTSKSERNHSYARRPVGAHDDFAWFWADGHAREMSLSYFYFSDIEGNAFRFPDHMTEDWMPPIPLLPHSAE